ncbi:hypothetical protein BDP27DRAFT_1400441 [Rhodocollybia butyracea]|uniref:Arylamine N-acetyltransferase n=1 Tax=Rhodocollybia butyracea TaxID=206335 RepID=A0A9P5UAG4_9AGAR|nr:hypothetical protein BDP27DRAFT_1400441 [Rhodocollybia butyracea]
MVLAIDINGDCSDRHRCKQSEVLPVDGQLREGLWIKTVPSAYDETQVFRYLCRIGFPGNWSVDSVKDFKVDLDNLALLMRLHIVAFAFENTAMHYAKDHAMDISLPGLYQRLVIEGKGSHCFGMNTLFLQMIRALGYRAYSGSGRLNTAAPEAPPTFITFTHQVLFVQPVQYSNTTYVVDVSGGGSGLTRPLLLKHGAKVVGATPSEWHTLVKAARYGSSLSPSFDSKESADVEWHLIISRTSDDGTITSKLLCSIIETEFFAMDYECSNISIYTGAWAEKEPLFMHNVVCSKSFWLCDEEMEREVAQMGGVPRWDGSLNARFLGRLGMLNNEVKRHVGTRSETLRIFRNELQRIDGLREFFGIEVPLVDMENIRGRLAALELP